MATLSQTGVQKVQEALQSLWKSGVCPFSGHQDWTIVDELVDVKPYKSRSNIGRFRSEESASPWFGPMNPHVGMENTYPAVMVVCNGCGFMALFSAVKLGLTDMIGETASG